MRTRTRATIAVAPALTAALALPGAVQAASLTVTGDDGTPVELTPGTAIRNMDAKVGATFGPTEKYYTLSVAGPAGPAGAATCYAAGSGPSAIDYQGNGTYSATLTSYSSYTCATVVRTVAAQYTVNAGVSIAPPAGNVLTRRPNEVGAGARQLRDRGPGKGVLR
jgi:hypothetical protein